MTPHRPRELLDQIETNAQPGYGMSSMVARLLLSLGRRDEPSRGSSALDEHDPIMVWLPFLPAFGDLRGTARFATILAAMHPARSALA